METTETKKDSAPEYKCRNCGATYVATSEEEITITKPCPLCKDTMDLIEK